MKVITYQSPNLDRITVCEDCERSLRGREWPKNVKGEEYCQIHRGLHNGICNICHDGIIGDDPETVV